MKNDVYPSFYLKTQFLEVKFSIYLNRHVFLMYLTKNIKKKLRLGLILKELSRQHSNFFLIIFQTIRLVILSELSTSSLTFPEKSLYITTLWADSAANN